MLYRSAAIYEMSCRMDVRQWGLSMSHLRAVIGLPHAEQYRLLTTAHREHWTVRRMEKACAGSRQQTRSRPVGRPPSPALLKGLSRLNRAIEQTGQAPINPEALDPDQRRAALTRIDAHLQQLSGIRQRLAAITTA